MESEMQKEKSNYEDNLKAEAYYEMLTDSLKSNRSFFEFNVKSINDVIKSGKFGGTKLLEIGSGATVHNIALPSKQYTNIVQSDFVADNYLELRKWHKGESTLDWNIFLEIAAEIDGYSDLKKGVKELESRVRSSVKRVVRCDVLSDPVLPLEELTTPETLPPYDLIVTCLTLASAAVDYESYVGILRRLHGLLKEGGGLIIIDFENGGRWLTGGVFFNYVKLSNQQVSDALEQVGFRIRNLELKVLKKGELDIDYEYESLFCVTAEKI